MSSDRYLAPITYSTQGLPLSTSSYSRPPLADTSGNNHYKPIILPDISHRSRSAYHSLDYSPPKYKPPPVPSQPTDLQRRRNHIRDARFNALSRNSDQSSRGDQHGRPSNKVLKRLIKNSPGFAAYRGKCTEKKAIAKWPDELEEHFLDALLSVPIMGRLKYSLDAKKGGWGRNEIIAKYLDVAYFNKPANRGKGKGERKQVSSHIQVLKEKLQDEPWFKWVIPEPKKLSGPEKEAETKRLKATFAIDPCLAALRRGRLPSSRRELKPWSFDLWTSGPKGPRYNFTQPGQLKYQSIETTEDTPTSLAQLFPQIKQASATNCDVIHIKASISLPDDPITEADLFGTFKISIPAEEAHLDWACYVTLNKHRDLRGPSEADPPIQSHYVPMKPVEDRDSDGGDCLMRVHFPAIAWSYALSRLSDMHESWKGGRTESLPSMSARQYLEQMTMCQEICSSAGNGPWEKRGVFIWTFTKTWAPTANTWSYVGVTGGPERSDVFEPHPGRQHEVQAMMAESFNSLYQPNSLSIQPINFDCLSYGPTPPLTATSQSPYTQYQYNHQHDILADDFPSISQAPQANTDVLSDHAHTQSHNSQHFDSYLQTQPDEALSISFDQASGMWHAPSQNQAPYEVVETYLPGYNTLPPLEQLDLPQESWERIDSVGLGGHVVGSAGGKGEQWTGASVEGMYAYDGQGFAQAK